MTAAFEEGERNYSPVQLTGFVEMCERPARERPRQLSRAEIKDLTRREFLVYKEQRAVWHANLGPIKTAQLRELHDGLAEIVDSNRQDGDKVKPSAVVDAFPGLGKTTAVLDYVNKYHRDQILVHGATTPSGHRRVPVVNITLTGNITIRGLNEAICRFYELPETGNADQLAGRSWPRPAATRYRSCRGFQHVPSAAGARLVCPMLGWPRQTLRDQSPGVVERYSRTNRLADQLGSWSQSWRAVSGWRSPRAGACRRRSPRASPRLDDHADGGRHGAAAARTLN
jgi:hypothetical protein